MVDFWDRGFKELFDRARDKFRQDEHDDLQREISGLGDSRIKRFLPHGHNSAQSSRDKQDKDALTALQILLLNNPAYAALYADTWDLLERAEAATEKALQEAGDALHDTQAAMDEIMSRAGRLPDGTAVFEDTQGNVWSETGALIDDEALAEIVWKPGSPSYEDYLEHKEALEAARLRVHELKEYQVDVLGRARDRLEDQKNPVEKLDGLKEINKDIQGGLDNVVNINESKADKANPEPTQQSTSDIGLPDFAV